MAGGPPVSGAARIGLVAAAVAVLVLAFMLLAPGEDDEPGDGVGARTATLPPAGGEAAETTRAAPPPAAPAFAPIRVRAGRPLGGVQTITVRRGERARIEVSSPDTTDEVHVHGYDISRQLNAGGRARLSFEADAEGVYEIELEGSHTQIGRLVVEP
ncbi:MAG TPA: hypothetical protein VG474_01095 [Solirubrobacteraceae bacterium]|nr:hypothetical protein [Solirubrobacteraceae bacterium]